MTNFDLYPFIVWDLSIFKKNQYYIGLIFYKNTFEYATELDYLKKLKEIYAKHLPNTENGIKLLCENGEKTTVAFIEFIKIVHERNRLFNFFIKVVNRMKEDYPIDEEELTGVALFGENFEKVLHLDTFILKGDEVRAFYNEKDDSKLFYKAYSITKNGKLEKKTNYEKIKRECEVLYKKRSYGIKAIYNFIENRIKELENKTATPQQIPPVEPLQDFKDSTNQDKIIILKELGVMDYLRGHLYKPDNISSLAEVLSAITGINAKTLNTYINPILNENSDQKNNPYNREENKIKANEILNKLKIHK